MLRSSELLENRDAAKIIEIIEDDRVAAQPAIRCFNASFPDDIPGNVVAPVGNGERSGCCQKELA